LRPSISKSALCSTSCLSSATHSWNAIAAPDYPKRADPSAKFVEKEANHANLPAKILMIPLTLSGIAHEEANLGEKSRRSKKRPV